MADVHSKEQRSRNMAAIKGKNTKSEIWLRKRLHACGFRYRLNLKELPGKPDIVLPKYKAAIFVHGCFWHMHHCHQFRLPATRTEWWEKKLTLNQGRDLNAQAKLRNSGWRVLIIWECAIKGRNRLPEEDLISEISSWIRNDSAYDEFPKAESCLTSTASEAPFPNHREKLTDNKES
ncbi:very short patch repair endonuclease [Nitrosomonas communis]|nr:very short patch repair endonuclease [Nitrosomonas communis]